jgi:hypothetical protein
VGSALNLPVNTWLKDGAYLPVPRPVVPDGDLLCANVDFDPHRYRDINQIIDVWLPLTLATNCTNRSMGQPDLYPFVLSPRVIDKPGYIGDLIHAA